MLTFQRLRGLRSTRADLRDAAVAIEAPPLVAPAVPEPAAPNDAPRELADDARDRAP